MNETTKAEIRKRLSNITQLQDVLFGDKIDEYNQKFEQYTERLDRLETNSQNFQLVVDERIGQLENKLLHRIDSLANSLEEKIKYSNSCTKEEQAKLQRELNSVSQNNYKSIDFLQSSLNNQRNNLKTEISQTKSALKQDMQLLKQQVLEQLESSLSQLTTDKISRDDLGEILFELSLKLQGHKSNLESRKNQIAQGLVIKDAQDRVETNSILPESTQLG